MHTVGKMRLEGGGQSQRETDVGLYFILQVMGNSLKGFKREMTCSDWHFKHKVYTPIPLATLEGLRGLWGDWPQSPWQR